MPQSQSRSYHSNLRALKNMAIIVGLFVVCWAPAIVLNITEALHPSFFIGHPDLRWIHSVVFAMFMFNSVVNPIVYAVRFRKFKAAFRLMLGCLNEEERQAVLESVTSLWADAKATIWMCWTSANCYRMDGCDMITLTWRYGPYGIHCLLLVSLQVSCKSFYGHFGKCQCRYLPNWNFHSPESVIGTKAFHYRIWCWSLLALELTPIFTS